MENRQTKRRSNLPLALAVLAVCAAACTPSSGRTKGKAHSDAAVQRLSECAARRLSAAPGNRDLVFVTGVVPLSGPNVPDGIMTGSLATVPASGGAPVRILGRGVTTLANAYALAGDGKSVAFLAGYDLAKGTGTLTNACLGTACAQGGEGTAVLSENVGFYGFSPAKPGGELQPLLGYISAGDFHLADQTTGEDRLVDTGVASFEFSPDGTAVAYRKSVSAGGELKLAPSCRPSGKCPPASVIAARVGDYSFSPDGRFIAATSRIEGPGAPYSTVLLRAAVPQSPMVLGENSGDFSFSADSRYLAFVANQAPGTPHGDLFLADLSSATGEALRKSLKQVGSSVSDYRFAPASDALAIREDLRNEKGQMWQDFEVVRLPSGETRLHQSALPRSFISYMFSEDGRELAFVKHVKLDVNLWRLDLEGTAAPSKVAPWAYQYRFPKADGERRELWYLGECIREGRECALLAAPREDAAPVATAEVAAAPDGRKKDGEGARDGSPAGDAAQRPVHPRVAQGFSAFEFSRDGRRLFLHAPRLDTANAFDLYWMDLDGSARPAADKPLSVDGYVIRDSLTDLSDGNGGVVAYIVEEKGREGVYLAGLSQAAPPHANP